MRVERAKELLRDPDRKLVDIAQACGFVDQSHFTRVFSRSEGYSPGRWRRLHRV
jgi:transcriptional regulator GlxA family with amidase domain